MLTTMTTMTTVLELRYPESHEPRSHLRRPTIPHACPHHRRNFLSRQRHAGFSLIVQWKSNDAVENKRTPRVTFSRESASASRRTEQRATLNKTVAIHHPAGKGTFCGTIYAHVDVIYRPRRYLSKTNVSETQKMKRLTFRVTNFVLELNDV